MMILQRPLYKVSFGSCCAYNVCFLFRPLKKMCENIAPQNIHIVRQIRDVPGMVRVESKKVIKSALLWSQMVIKSSSIADRVLRPRQ